MGGWHKRMCPTHQLLGRAALQDPHLHSRSGSQACSCTWSLVPHAVPQRPRAEEGGDLTQGAFFVISEQRRGGLGSPAQVVQGPCSRQDGGLENSCMSHCGTLR